MSTTLRTITGKENMLNQSFQAEVYLLPSQDLELPLWSASRTTALGDITMLGIGNRSPSLFNVAEAIGGSWRSNQYEIGDGHIMKLVIRKKVGFGGVVKTMAMYFRTRSEAAMRRISVNTLRAPGQSTRNEIEVVGRFDIISLQDVLAAGRTVNRNTHYQSMPTNVQGVFTVTELEPEVKPRVVVETKVVHTQTGEAKVMPVQRPGRSIRL